MSSTIVWFRRDLRLDDNPAWNWALKRKAPILPIYIHAPGEEQPWSRGAASKWWLHQALQDLSAQLKQSGSQLLIFKAETNQSSQSILDHILHSSGAKAIVWNRCYEPAFVERDSKIKAALTKQGISVESMNGSLLCDPLSLRNRSGKPFQVFTPFWKHCLQDPPRPPIHSDDLSITHSGHRSYSGQIPGCCNLEKLNLLPTKNWDTGISQHWQATRKSGLSQLQKTAIHCCNYHDQRDIPAIDGTSQLSAYLHFGQISPHEFHHHLIQHSASAETAQSGILRQLYWREFSAHLLYHYPHSQSHALKPEYDLFPWKFNRDHLQRWQDGTTGFPIIDAGMRQLWQTGWMHNRVRMITASFLVKHLLQPWQEGARWFWDTLVDADLANNTMGWQWIAGSGADASPYFRIFNPILQSKKFDPDGSYIRTWIPELRDLPAKWIHTPWDFPGHASLPKAASGAPAYPSPIIPHTEGRERALEAYRRFTEIKKQYSP
ncbi:deoxyribodipyrimidine photo-lyase [Verrucomicrobiaceae bacterium N1E253]|uniref:Deoxyribodipyrimidine photo-lyase n=1 Tax=Oceaniferula marina TaxID=2748318 RepID=A0A851G900_9BACT|nr:deoxyribodipyrimidine photo-lyase [Oceaniferula marina]NWK54083.1 deoxyribodipyrimidine photo-lyase [Oceaniferula marina]